MKTYTCHTLRLWIFLAVCCGVVNAQDEAQTQFDTLAGDLPAIILPGENPYLVVDDIYVPHGKTVTIKAGAVLLFNNFTGLQVQGRLLVKGTSDTPVVFTSVNDKEHNRQSQVDPAPFDWNGIYLHEDAIGSELYYSAVLYSVEGIVSKTRFVKIAPGLFLHNGRSSLSIEGEEHEVGTEPYDYAISLSDPTLDGIPLSVLDDPFRIKRSAARYSGITLAVGGALAGIFFTVSFNENNRTFKSLSSKDANNLADNSAELWNEALRKRNKDLGGMIAGWALMIAGTGGLYWSFTF